MITGENGFIRRFADAYGYDQDVLTEYLMTIDAVRGIVSEETCDKIVFCVNTRKNRFSVFTFADGKCYIDNGAIAKAPNGDAFLRDIGEDNGEIPVPETTEDFDNTILAIYRFMHDL